MGSVVFCEHELPGEGFPTQMTSMGLLTSVDDLVMSQPRLLDEGFPTVAAYMRFLYFLSVLRLGTSELRFSADEFSICREFNFSMKLFTRNMEKGFPISRNLSRVLYFTVSALVNQR